MALKYFASGLSVENWNDDLGREIIEGLENRTLMTALKAALSFPTSYVYVFDGEKSTLFWENPWV